ncbi:hypothetical protein SUGI_0680500 [Cryptomeria japonica]|uniref:FCS-Like Zinc finger 11 n=1 Tax=Cryptomeria japonica TaxID=3369 RepID=UPI0024147B98|nr:FCS-Like Zinc finger 11 [Cryptomeria japonica]GLJ33856.1 hypothetical protein SUGI_0680500 [Cryptomeria japonica]
MLGKRPRVPSMRRTTSMSQMGSGSCSPASELVPKEKQRATFPAGSQLRAPGSGQTSVPSWKLNPSDSVQKCSNGAVLSNQHQISALGALPEDMGMSESLHSAKPLFMGSQGQAQFHFQSGNSDFHSQKPIMSSIGAASEVSGDHVLSIIEAAHSGGGSSGSVYGVRVVEPAHFLQACFLCTRRLGHGQDIYMYRDDRAFCSAECRYQQIVIDEHNEKRSVKVITTGAVPSVRQHNNGKNAQSRKVKNIQSARRAAA